MDTIPTPQKIGTRAEVSVQGLLRAQGFKAIRAPYLSPFDLVVDGARVEVKSSRPDKHSRWLVNIHRHGVLREERVDAYVVILYNVPGYELKPLSLVFRAPLGVMTLQFSFKTLLAQFSDAIDNWDLLRTICKEARENLPKPEDADSKPPTE